MSFLFDPFNLLLLGIALIILWRLRSVFGMRNGNERPPFDPYAARQAEVPRSPDAANANLSRLPQPANDEPVRPAAEPPPPIWTGFATADSPLAAAMEKLAAADPSFSPKVFVA